MQVQLGHLHPFAEIIEEGTVQQRHTAPKSQHSVITNPSQGSSSHAPNQGLVTTQNLIHRLSYLESISDISTAATSSLFV
jgi:hypothetical protein